MQKFETLETESNSSTTPSQAVPQKIKPAEKHSRSLAKSITYRLLSITADSVVAYLFTRNIALSAGIVIFVNGYSIILYYFHERLWAHIHWGREKINKLI